MELEELVGLHELTGVSFETQLVPRWFSSDRYEDCQCINFILDGKTYTAVEDPDDGYRSSMSEIKISDITLGNQFEPVKVLGMMRDGDYNVLDLVDVVTGKIVLSVGTDHSDNYYPCFVSDWQPENLCLNQNKS